MPNSCARIERYYESFFKMESNEGRRAGGTTAVFRSVTQASSQVLVTAGTFFL